MTLLRRGRAVCARVGGVVRTASVRTRAGGRAPGRSPRDHDRDHDGDHDAEAGFTLVEVMVAMALLAVMSTALLSLVNTTIRTATDAGSRVVAADLASRELEIVRDTFSSQSRGPAQVRTGQVTNASPLPGGSTGAPLVVDGVPYTVVRTTQWRNVDSPAASTCDEGTTLEFDYLRVQVEVSWPGLGDRQPVAMSTQMTPPKGTYDATRAVGHIGLKVLDREGKPKRGVTVAASRSGATRSTVTGTDGCALIDSITPGSWAITVSAPGFVTQQGAATGTLTAGVQDGQLWTGSIPYDEAARLEVAVCPAAGHPLPESLSGAPVTLANSGLLPTGAKAFAGTGTRETRDCSTDGARDREDVVEVRTVGSLWPYASGYQPWLGGCLENDPQYTGQVRDLPVASNPGQTSQATLQLVGVDIAGAPAGSTLVATQVTTNADGTDGTADSACQTGQSITLGRVTGGAIATSLPYGRWRITTLSATTPTAVVTITKDGGTQAVTLS